MTAAPEGGNRSAGKQRERKLWKVLIPLGETNRGKDSQAVTLPSSVPRGRVRLRSHQTKWMALRPPRGCRIKASVHLPLQPWVLLLDGCPETPSPKGGGKKSWKTNEAMMLLRTLLLHEKQRLFLLPPLPPPKVGSQQRTKILHFSLGGLPTRASS